MNAGSFKTNFIYTEEEPGIWDGGEGVGSYTGDFDRRMEGSSGGASVCERDHGEGSFAGETQKWDFWEICKMSCKRASLSTGTLLGDLEGVRLPGLLREMKSICGFLLKVLSLDETLALNIWFPSFRTLRILRN